MIIKYFFTVIVSCIFTLNAYSQCAIIEMSVSNVTCNGGSDGEIVLDAPTSCVSPTTYSWSHGASGPVASNLSAGLYEVTLTDGAGTQDFKNWIITEPGVIDISINGDSPFCAGDSDGFLVANATGGTPDYTYSWSNGVTTNTNNNVPAGIYTVTVTDANGCTAMETVAVSDPAPVEVVTTEYNNILCAGQANGHIAVEGQGGDDLYYTYQWSTGSTDSVITNLISGIYTVTVSDFNLCTSSATYSIFEPSDILVTFPIINDLDCYEDASGSIEINAAGGTGTLSYAWSNGATTNTINNLQAGSYTLTITDANACTFVDTYSVGQPDEIIETEPALVQNVSCNGLANGEIEVYLSGGTGTLSYSWSNGSNDTNLENLSAGSYTLTVTDASNCTYTNTYFINEPSPISVSFPIITNVSCPAANDGRIEINPGGGTPGYTYSWSNGANTNIIENLSAGNYTVTISDANDCQLIETYTIDQPSDIIVTNPIIENASCNGTADGSIEINPAGGTPGYSYAWSNGANTNIANNLSAGNYTVTISDANNCQQIESYTITEPSNIIVTNPIIVNASCNGAADGSIEVNPAGGTPAYSYSWSNSSLDNNINEGLSAGSYTLTITDNNACTFVESYTITEPSAITIITEDINNISCNGDANGYIEVSADGGNGGYSYSWSNGNNGPIIDNLTPDFYTVTVSDANNCTEVATYEISEPDMLLSNATVNDELCFGDANGQITLNPTGGTAPYNYNWSNGETSSSIDNLEPDTYEVTITDANDCQIIESYEVEYIGFFTLINQTGNAITCFGGNDGSITIEVVGATPVSYLWEDGTTGPTLDNLEAGLQEHNVTVSDENGCESVFTITASLTEPEELIIIEEELSSVSCNGEDDGVIEVSAQGGSPSYNYIWSNGSNGATLQNASAGSYTVTVSDSKGCTASSSFSITEPAAISSNSAITNVSCPLGTDGEINLTPSGGTSGYSYQWSTGANTNAIQNLMAGIYEVSITDANDCVLIESYNVLQPELFTVSGVEINDLTCAGADDGSISIIITGGTGSLSYQWSNGSTDNNITNLPAGLYSVVVTDEMGCSTQSETFEVSSPDAISINTINQTNNLCHGDSLGDLQVIAEGGTGTLNYSWSNGADTPLINGLAAGEYSLTVTDENNCIATNIYTITQADMIIITEANVIDASCHAAQDGSISLTATGGTGTINYAWSNGATSASINELSAGTYTVTLTDENACYIEASYTLNEPTEIIIEGEVTATECGSSNTGAISTTTSGGAGNYQYLWSNGATTPNINNLASANYTLSVTDADGCTAVQEFFVSQPGDISITSSQIENNICPEGAEGSIAIEADGGVGSLSYLWSTGAIENNIHNLANGNYSITITDENGCNLSQSFEITSPEPIATSNLVTQNVSCFGGNDGLVSFGIDGGIAPYVIEFVFTPIDGSDILSFIEENISASISKNFSAGDLMIKITDSNNCQVELEGISISQPEILSTSNIEVIDPTCFSGANGEVKFQISGGVSPYEVKVTYMPLIGDTVEESITVSQEFNYSVAAGSIQLELVDANNCILGLPSLSIAEPAQMLNTDPEIRPALCHGDTTGQVSFNIIGGTAPYNVEWSYTPNNGGEQLIEFVFNQTDEIAQNFGAGIVQAKVTDANACELIIPNITITEAAPIAISDIEVLDAFCDKDTSGMVNFFISGGNSPYSVEWKHTPSEGGEPLVILNDNLVDLAMENFAPGMVTALITDANGCTMDINPIEIKTSYNIAVDIIEIVAPTCGKDSSGMISIVAKEGASPYSVEWTYTPVGGTESQIQETYNIADTVSLNFGAGIVSIHVEDANGCSFSIDEIVLDNIDGVQLEEIKVSYTDTLGIIELITDIDPSLLKYEWSGPNGFNANTHIITNLEDGKYSCIITDPNGCQITTGDIEIMNIVSTNEIDYSHLYQINTLVEDQLYLKYFDSAHSQGNIMSLNGELLLQFDIQQGDQSINLGQLPDAIYILRILVGDKVYAIPVAKF